MLYDIPMIKRYINLDNTYLRNGCHFTDLATYLCCSPFSFAFTVTHKRMHHTGFSKRIHRSIQLISVCLSSSNQINPQLAYASVDLSPSLPGGGGEANSRIPLIPQLALLLQLTASVKERAQKYNWGSRERVEQWTLNFESTLTAAERNIIMIWWGLGVFYY